MEMHAGGFFAEIGDSHAGMVRAWFRSNNCAISRQKGRDRLWCWAPHFRKMEVEAPRVSPSRAGWKSETQE
jgi:hypothetical protein